MNVQSLEHTIYIDHVIEFGGSVYKELAKERLEAQSFSFSPVSLQLVLYLTFLGAEGHTATELINVAQIPIDPAVKIIEQYLSSHLKFNDTHIFNDIFADNVYPTKSYIETIKKFNVHVQNIKIFATVPLTINHWIAAYTGNSIEQIQSEIDLLLSNVVSVEGKWKVPFRRSSHIFHSAKGDSENQMLFATGYFNYLKDDDLNCEYVELPLDKNDVSLVVVVPIEKHLANLEKNITEVLKNSIYLYTPKYLNIHIPRHFSKPSTINLMQVLNNLGLKAPFRDDADFEQLSKSLLKMEDVLQNTGVLIDAQDVYFSSASVNVAKIRTTRSTDHVIAKDPFIYYVKHRELGPLILGRFVIPEKRY